MELERITAVFSFATYESDDRSYCVYKYSNTCTGKSFVAVGRELPRTKDLPVDLVGRWKPYKKTGELQFAVEYAEKAEVTGEQQVVAYFRNLKCGVGRIIAKNIYRAFGDSSIDVVRNNPNDLLRVRGMNRKKLDRLTEAVKRDTISLDVIKLFSESGVGVSGNIIYDIIKVYDENTYRVLTDNPYQIIGKVSAFKFGYADAVAKFLGFPNNDPNRLEAATIEIFRKFEHSGSVCETYDKILKKTQEFAECTRNEANDALFRLYKKNAVKRAGQFFYETKVFNEEGTVVNELVRLLTAANRPINQVDAFIDDYEKANITLADCQREAVRNVFKYNVNIVTGGPGVGKTTVAKAILATHKGIFGASSEPLLLAPTGKAARRMSEATGYPAQTIHSALGWTGDDKVTREEPLEGNLILVDEVSMMDQQIAAHLFSHIATGAKLVMIGDIDQLPSVGYGNVLNDMIQSGCVPTTRLNVVFRQAADNPIVANAHKINVGDANIRTTNTFVFYERHGVEDVMNEACKRYLQVVEKYGIDKVILLNPQRHNTELSIGAFNERLQESLNPHKDGELEIKVGKTVFRKGDRVMETKNGEFARNGDVGYIRAIEKREDEPDSDEFNLHAIIEFNDSGELIDYNADEMSHVELGYCTTVHKSQGSEYETVIQIVSAEHQGMLLRNLIYTGITRAKVNCVLIGDRVSFEKAVRNDRKDARNTNLPVRLRQAMEGLN